MTPGSCRQPAFGRPAIVRASAGGGLEIVLISEDEYKRVAIAATQGSDCGSLWLTSKRMSLILDLTSLVSD